MRYRPPPTWPPPPDWPPPTDDWRPPGGWKPRFQGLLIPPDADGYLLAFPPPEPDSGEAAAGHEARGSEAAPPSPQQQAEIHRRRVTRMLGMWARDVLRAAHSYYQAAVRAAWTDRAIEHAEDWSPDQADLLVEIEQVWVRGYHLVMAATQMEQWLGVYRSLTAEPAAGGDDDAEQAEHDQLLKTLRNTIEHLNDAQMTHYAARRHPDSQRRRESITQLPGEELFLGFAPGFENDLFGLVNVSTLVEKARAHADVDRDRTYDDFEPDDID
jgi:hypothetical protein